MIAIDKIKTYLLSISNSEEHYKRMLEKVWINPERRNKPCVHPELECANCPDNHFKHMVK